MKRKIIITEGSRTVTIEDDGETPLDSIINAPHPPSVAPIIITSPYRFIPVAPQRRYWLTGSCCSVCGTYWPSPWFSILPPCSCANPYAALPWQAWPTTTFTTTTTTSEFATTGTAAES